MQNDNPGNLTDLQRIAVLAAGQKAQRDAFEAKLNAAKIAEEAKANAARTRGIEAMGNQNTVMQPTPTGQRILSKSPIARGIGGVIQNAADVVGLGGVGLLNAAKTVAENVLWDEPSQFINKKIEDYNKYLENRPLGRGISWLSGMPNPPEPGSPSALVSKPAVTPSAVAPPPAPIDTAATMGDVKTAALGPDAAVKNRNDELYAAINRLDDKAFLRFMKDNPEIPGLGYIKGEDGRMVRFAENPDHKKKEPMSPIEMDAVSRMLLGTGHIQAGIGARENAAATKEATADYRKEALWEKSAKATQDLVGVLGKNPNTDQIDPELAYYKMAKNNIPLRSTMNDEDRKSFRAAMDTAFAPAQALINKAEAKAKRKLTQEERFTILNKYEKERGWAF